MARWMGLPSKSVRATPARVRMAMSPSARSTCCGCGGGCRERRSDKRLALADADDTGGRGGRRRSYRAPPRIEHRERKRGERLTARRTATSSRMGAPAASASAAPAQSNGNDLGVGFGNELVTLSVSSRFRSNSFRRCRCGPRRCGGAVAMGWRSLRWGGREWPSGCGRCECAIERVLGENLFKVVQLARSAANVERGAGWTAHGDACRVVAAVFKAPQPSMMTGTTFFGPTYPTIPHMKRFYATTGR